MLGTMFNQQYITGLIVSLSAVAAGCIFAWVDPIVNFFLDPTNEPHMTSSEISWMIVMPEVGSVLFSIPAGKLGDSLGRKPLILICGPILFISWIGILFFGNSYLILSLMRCLQGVTLAIIFTVVPLYMGEISSPDKRGAITSMFSNSLFFGYLLEYCVGPNTSYKVFTALTALIPFIFTILFYFQPESPYLLLMKGKDEEAKKCLKTLSSGISENDLLNEIDKIKSAVKEYTENPTSIKDVFATSSSRRALFVLLLIGNVRLLSGSFVLASYSTNLFSISGPYYISPDLLTIVMGAILFFGGFLNTFVVDKFGRRPLLLISSTGSFFCLVILTIYFYISEKFSEYKIYNWIVPFTIMVYSTFLVVGLYPAQVTYTSELFTAKTKGAASSISSLNLTFGVAVSIKVYQIILDSLGLSAAFLFFSVCSLFGIVLLYMFAPETKGKTFSQIQEDLINVTTQKTHKSSSGIGA